MISKQQADTYIKKHSKIEISIEQLDSFSEPYKTLGLILTNQLVNDYRDNISHVSFYEEKFGKDPLFSPWKDKEGLKLAETLFGPMVGPSVAAMWDFMNELPYQSGYSRRPFRMNTKVTYVKNKIDMLTRLYYAGASGFNSMCVADQIAYSIYQDHTGSSLFWAVLLRTQQQEYYPLLEEIFLGEHEVAGVSRELIKTLLLTESDENHLLVEKLLLAAQQQEGLRQSILESLDFTTIKAIKRFIKVMLEHNLMRFSSVVRAVDTWFGFGWDAPKTTTVKRTLELADTYLNDLNKIKEGLEGQDNLALHVALWVIGLYNVDEANKLAFDLVLDENNEKIKKLVALFFIAETARTRTEIVAHTEKNLGQDIELDYWLLVNFPHFEMTDVLFAKIITSARSLPAVGKVFTNRAFSWKSYTIKPAYFFDKVIDYAKPRHYIELAKDLSAIPSSSREKLMRNIFPKHYSWSYRNEDRKEVEVLELAADSWQRTVARQAITDRNTSVSATGINLFKSMDLYPEEIEILENILNRKGKDLRKASIELLASQPEIQIKRSVQKLISSSNIDQRLAALEILTVLEDKNWLPEFVREQAEAYKDRKLSKNEQVFIDKLVKQSTEFNYLNGFGVIDYRNLTDFTLPEEKFKRKKGLSKIFSSSAFLFKELIGVDKTTKAVNDLFELFEKNKDYEYKHEGYQGETLTSLLGNSLMYVKKLDKDATAAERLNNLPLADLWKQWYRQSQLNDFELYAVVKFCRDYYNNNDMFLDLKDFKETYLPIFVGVKIDKQSYFYGSKASQIVYILEHIADAFADKKAWVSYKLDVFEDSLYHFPEELKNKNFNASIHYYAPAQYWTNFIMSMLYGVYENDLDYLNEDQKLHFWKLQLYLLAQQLARPTAVSYIQDVVQHLPHIINPEKTTELNVPYTELTLHLFDKKAISHDDLLFLSLLHKDLFFLLDGGQNYYTKRFSSFTIPKINQKLKENLLRVELERGELPTEASKYIANINYVNGVKYFFEVLQRMGKEKFDRGYSYGIDVSKKYTFSRILKLGVPSEEELYTAFEANLKVHKFDKKRLVEVSCYATQWSDWLGKYLKIEKLEEAVWWFLAHTTDYMDAEKETIISRYSNVPKNDFRKGAIDIEWFNRVYRSLGKANWKLVHESAKYLSDGMGYRRVKLYSSVLLGDIKITETINKIEEKRDKDYVMALGLIPISKANPEADLLKRYNLLQIFLKESKQFGAQRQESERNAVEIGLDNLARNAGYDDSIRFSWAMEGKATQKIMENATLQLDDFTVQLIVDEQGKADLLFQKGDKFQKTIPDKYKNDKKIQQLKDGKTYLSKQYSRTKQSLENAMLRSDTFGIDELEKIMQHPIVKAMMSKLVLFHTETQRSGFWQDGTLKGVDGKTIKLQSEDKLRIAHPAHLYQAVQWDVYQKYIFEQEIQQPFKQVFRELYLPTVDELEHSNRSERYQGYQIQPNKTVALLRSRGWTVNYEEGLQKVYHKEGYRATLFAMADWFSPSDVEAPTLEYVCFYSLNDNILVPLTKVDPVIFSEVMRDVDLVISVAHVGDVDPEASHSTMQMRGALARESARLFKLDNIEVKERYIIIQGALGNYNIHLGSGMVSKDGLQLSIIPIHSQHRGPMFLPFIDDDPKSAEIISKMRLLAQDTKIKDPTILGQINR